MNMIVMTLIGIRFLLFKSISGRVVINFAAFPKQMIYVCELMISSYISGMGQSSQGTGWFLPT